MNTSLLQSRYVITEGLGQNLIFNGGSPNNYQTFYRVSKDVNNKYSSMALFSEEVGCVKISSWSVQFWYFKTELVMQMSFLYQSVYLFLNVHSVQQKLSAWNFLMPKPEVM